MPLRGFERREAKTSPMQIAHDPLLTTREKIELLQRLKAEVTGADANPDHLGAAPEEIDAAIAELQLEVQDGDRPQPSILGGGYLKHDTDL